MATKQFGVDFAAAGTLTGTETLSIVQSGVTVDTTTQAIANLAPASGVSDGDKGDVVVSSSGTVWTVDSDAVSNTKLANMAQSTLKGRASGAGTGDPTDLSAAQVRAILGSQAIGIACSDETTALTAGTTKATFRMPFAFTLTAVRATLTTAQTSGSIFTVDINEAGTTILSTKLTIDNTEKTSTTAATAPVISDTSLADDAEITVDIDQIGDGTAKGLKIWLIGYAT